MRTVIQRVKQASVRVGDDLVGSIQNGLLIFVGVGHGDTETEAKWLARKIAVMRIFADDEGKFNRSLLDVNGSALVVSQFTLYADPSQRRPSFIKAAPPQLAEGLVVHFCECLREAGVRQIETGRFGAMMLVSLENDGPVTILLNRETPDQPPD